MESKTEKQLVKWKVFITMSLFSATVKRFTFQRLNNYLFFHFLVFSLDYYKANKIKQANKYQ